MIRTRARNSGGPQSARSGHTTGSKKNFSDQIDAVPLINGDRTGRNGSRGGTRDCCHREAWHSGRKWVGEGKPLAFGELVGADRRERQRLRSRGGPACAACRGLAGRAATPGQDGLRRRRRARRDNRLSSGQEQTEKDRKPDSHRTRFSTFCAGSKDYFAGFFSASSIFFTYLAESFLKSLRQDLQQSLISRPS